LNELSIYRLNVKAPILEVALYEYGNKGISKWSGYVKQLSPFTADLDRLSSLLFALRTNGGEEYCGVAINTAIEGLTWSKRKDALKLMYIAGNEPFNQGPLPYGVAIQSAKTKGVVVNTIYCGDTNHVEAQSWIHGAQMALGSYMSIDQNHRLVDVTTPYDQDIKRLGAALNQTYLPFGADGGKSAMKKQADADAGSLMMGMRGTVSRAKAKTSNLYKNESWDLVDALEASPEQTMTALGSMSGPMLPEAVRSMPAAEAKKVIQRKGVERKNIQREIKSLAKKREKFLATKATSMNGKEAPNTLNKAFLESIRKAAKTKGLSAP